jgi:hypothetical protein
MYPPPRLARAACSASFLVEPPAPYPRLPFHAAAAHPFSFQATRVQPDAFAWHRDIADSVAASILVELFYPSQAPLLAMTITTYMLGGGGGGGTVAWVVTVAWAVALVCGALDGVPLLWMASATAATTNAATTTAATPTAAHILACDEIGLLAVCAHAGGADAGGADAGGADTGGADGPTGGLECTMGIGGGAGAVLIGVGVFCWCCACSMAWPRT